MLIIVLGRTTTNGTMKASYSHTTTKSAAEVITIIILGRANNNDTTKASNSHTTWVFFYDTVDSVMTRCAPVLLGVCKFVAVFLLFNGQSR